MVEKKKLHGVQLLIRTVVTDPKGKVIQDSGQKQSKSFVIAFLRFLYGVFDGADVLSPDTSNSSEKVYIEATTNFGFTIMASINIDTFGIVLGTGDTGETNADYKLDVQLTEGAGAGNITHGVQQIDGVAEIVGANVDMECKRSFPNNTGSTITVKEAGMYARMYTKFFCIIRDVLGVPVVLPDKCALTVYYTLRTTV